MAVALFEYPEVKEYCCKKTALIFAHWVMDTGSSPVFQVALQQNVSLAIRVLYLIALSYSGSNTELNFKVGFVATISIASRVSNNAAIIFWPLNGLFANTFVSSD